MDNLHHETPWLANKTKVKLSNFRYAWHGILSSFQKEPNISFFAGLGILITGFWWVLERRQAVPVNLCLTLLLVATEMQNKSIEILCDEVRPERNESIKHTKDIASGAVAVVGAMLVVYQGYKITQWFLHSRRKKGPLGLFY